MFLRLKIEAMITVARKILQGALVQCY